MGADDTSIDESQEGAHRGGAGGFLVGDGFTVADIAVASPFVNLRHAHSPVDPAVYPRLTAYLEAIHARPSFAALIAKDEALLDRARARSA